MEESLTNHHLHHHTSKLRSLIIIVLIILAAGEFYLYRQQMQIKTMMSEGFMQLKEEMKSNAVAPTTPSYAPVKY